MGNLSSGNNMLAVHLITIRFEFHSRFKILHVPAELGPEINVQ